jgi:hypothetical protein
MLSALIGTLALAPQAYSATFPGGTRVRLLAVADGAAKQAWSPMGARFGKNPLPASLRNLAKATAGNARLIVTEVRLRRPEAPSVAMQVVGGPVRPALSVAKVGAGAWDALGVANHGSRIADVRIGVADRSWKRVGSVAPQAGGALKRSGQGFLRMVRPDDSGMGGAAIIAEVVLPVDVNAQAFRVQAYDRSGSPMKFLQALNQPGSPVPDRYWFAGRYEAVGRVELQVRPYVWKTFKGVALEPK